MPQLQHKNFFLFLNQPWVEMVSNRILHLIVSGWDGLRSWFLFECYSRCTKTTKCLLSKKNDKSKTKFKPRSIDFLCPIEYWTILGWKWFQIGSYILLSLESMASEVNLSVLSLVIEVQDMASCHRMSPFPILLDTSLAHFRPNIMQYDGNVVPKIACPIWAAILFRLIVPKHQDGRCCVIAMSKMQCWKPAHLPNASEYLACFGFIWCKMAPSHMIAKVDPHFLSFWKCWPPL